MKRWTNRWFHIGVALAAAGLLSASLIILSVITQPASAENPKKPAAKPIGMTCIEDPGTPIGTQKPDASKGKKRMTDKVSKTEKEWKEQLTPEQYRITREKGTERAFSGEYYNCHDKGTYKCVCCGAELFSSDTKFESGSGWPSFYQPMKSENVKEEHDNTHGMVRTEVVCNKCGAHLGHVFPDGPKPTNLRYCINSQSLKLEKK